MGEPGPGLWAATETTRHCAVEKIGMASVRLTHNAVVGYQRVLAPSSSLSSAYSELKRAVQRGRFEQTAPAWVARARKGSDGYVLLEGDLAALPVRGGRAVACLAKPHMIDRLVNCPAGARRISGYPCVPSGPGADGNPVLA